MINDGMALLWQELHLRQAVGQLHAACAVYN
jgi:hypothetical protein